MDVTSWRELLVEVRGLRTKAWVESDSDGTRWLRKEPRDHRPNEPAIEAVMLWLAKQSKIAAAIGRLCHWTDADGVANHGLIVKSFISCPEEEELHLGSSFISRALQRSHWEHTPWLVVKTLRELDLALVPAFCKIVAFDAWIGNGDRHAENWGVIGRGSSYELAPLYDPACCLGAELQDQNLEKFDDVTALERYVRRCRSGFGDGLKMLPMDNLVGTMFDYPEWQNGIGGWLGDFRRALNDLELLVAEGLQWLPAQRQLLALRLLRLRLERLRQTCASA